MSRSRDPLHLDEAARRLDLRLETGAGRQEPGHDGHVVRGLDLRDDHDVGTGLGHGCEIVPPPRRADPVDPHGGRPARARAHGSDEQLARRIGLLLGSDAVLEVEHDLVRGQRGRLRQHPRARRRNGQARPAGPRRHGRNLTVSLHPRYGPLTWPRYRQVMETGSRTCA